MSLILFFIDYMYPPNESFMAILKPWFESLKDPAEAQNKVLLDLVKTYARTQYGEEHTASEVKGIDDYRKSFPTVNYQGLRTYLEEVKNGNFKALLSENPLYWVMTRGSTGVAKILPATKTHLEQILTCGSRVLVNYVVRTRDIEISEGKFLNLGFPSRVQKMDKNNNAVWYGYSSGTYARLFPTFGSTSLIPQQEEIDALSSGITKRDWEKRFELIYDRASKEKVTAAIGVAPVILSFARFIKSKHGINPKEKWNIRAIFCTSVRKIHSRYAPKLRKYFGKAPTIEMYSATEGVFAQQINDLPYVTPNYDKYLFEVKTGKGFKMLHELERGEWGKLIISSCMFPRYNIGDMVEAAGKNYFRIFGRDKSFHILEHRLHRLFLGWAL